MKSTVKIPPACLKNPVHFLALGFGTGLMPKAPGTFGTLAAIPVYYAISNFSTGLYVSVVLFVSLAGIAICDYTSKQLRVHDHPGIVFDEISGYLLTMIAVPSGIWWMMAGFVAFRIFDILKPWPISWLDKHVHGGLGIMLDDLLAGVMACLVLHLINGLLS
ncbi:MAG: phosphatidylglycerophosphatase [Pseudomonadota bacterium]|nr:phosphatidylglycerophosphatase [Pseudomonadota bacterium]